ncbi:MAG: ribosomal protein S18-alanine N-acetyltransferase, partial [Armatimonadetes bacterium]|nr:ribosomal protein S18-alanine N-acetyltransferase [Armatimonadota bacterium]
TGRDYNGEVTVRRARVTDLGDIMRIERESFPTPWSENSMARELRNQDGSLYFVVEVAGHVCGYVGGWTFGGQLHILTIAVDREWRGLGLGELLMLVVLDAARQRGCSRAVLEYRVSNVVAEALYRKLGFNAVAVRPGYYVDTGEDAVCATIEDLLTDERGAELARLREVWQQKHGWHVVYE